MPKILQDEGYIAGYKLVDDKPAKAGGATRPITGCGVKYGPGGERVIWGIQRVSRPGRRVYAGADAMPTVLGGLGVSILTTSRGVMTGRAAWGRPAWAARSFATCGNGGARVPGSGTRARRPGARRADQFTERPETHGPRDPSGTLEDVTYR